MGVVRNLMVRAGADFSGITKQANKAKSSMSGMQSSVSKSCDRMTKAVSGMNKIFGALGVTLSVAAIVSFSKNAKAAYDEQTEASTKLAAVMRNTMGARAEEVKSIEDLIDAQERLGIVDGAVQTEGAQELATYLSLSKSLQTLIPVMNDMIAQQYGMSASAESAVSIATMMGKVMSGQTSALSRYGYTFTAAQEAVLKYGTEAQRAAVLAEVVSQSVGGMNAALAATPNGRMQQLRFTMGKIQEDFGKAASNVSVLFIPALNGVCSVLATLATLANKVAQALANVFGSSGTAAASTVSYTAAAASGMNDIAQGAEEAGKATKSLSTFGFDTLQKMSGGASSGAAATGDDAGPGPGGVITETDSGAAEAGESIGWLENGLTKLKGTIAALDFEPLLGSFDRLKQAVEPLAQGAFSGLAWAYDNVLAPLAAWTVTDVAPAFLNLMAGAASALSASASALQPMAEWLWTNFLVPIGTWTGGVIVSVLEGLATALSGISGWISENQGLVQGMTVVVGAFFAAWHLATLGEFLVCAGGIPGVIAKITAALWACTGAKIADKAETLAICALYVKDWAVALAGNVVAIGKDIAAWVALKAEWIASKAALVASTVAQAAHTAASWAGTAATTAMGVALNVLCSPITLVVAAIAALIAGIVLLVKNWDTVKAAGAAAWENIKKVWGSAASWFTKKVIDPIVKGFKLFANGIIAYYEGLGNGAIKAINFIIGAFNKLKFDVPEWVPIIGGKTWGFNIPTVPSIKLPRLAEGAVFKGNNPYMAIVNDQRHGVNVESPLSTITEAMMLALQGSNYGENIVVNVKAVFEGQLAALARLLRPYFEADAQRVGPQASTAKGGI